MTQDQALDERVLLFLDGQGRLRCAEIAEDLAVGELELRRSLIRLMNRGDVHKQYMRNGNPPGYYYERSYGGYNGPFDGSAA